MGQVGLGGLRLVKRGQQSQGTQKPQGWRLPSPLPTCAVFLRLCSSSVASLTGWVSLLFPLDIWAKSNYSSGNYHLITEPGPLVLQLWIPPLKREAAFCAPGLGQGLGVFTSPGIQPICQQVPQGTFKAFL